MSEPCSHGGRRKGAGRKAGPDGRSRIVSRRVPIRLWERFEVRAGRDGMSSSEALVAAIRAYLGEVDRD